MNAVVSDDERTSGVWPTGCGSSRQRAGRITRAAEVAQPVPLMHDPGPIPLDGCTYTVHTGHMNTNRPALPVHVVNRCKFAALTFPATSGPLASTSSARYTRAPAATAGKWRA